MRIPVWRSNKELIVFGGQRSRYLSFATRAIVMTEQMRQVVLLQMRLELIWYCLS